MPTKTEIELLTGLISALSAYCWPSVTLVLMLIFRHNVSEFIERFRRGKLFGQEVELEPAPKAFEQIVEKASKEQAQSRLMVKQPDQDAEGLDNEIDEILKAASINPDLGIIRLSATIEREVRTIAASVGDIRVGTTMSVPQIFDLLVKERRLHETILESLNAFWKLRNQVVHGAKSVDTRTTLQILDSGLSLLKVVRSIPHTINIVESSNIEVYEDKECTKPRNDVKGLILEFRNNTGEPSTKQIFPTTNPSYYHRGMRVSREWDFSRSFGQSWYVDPVDKLKKEAWTWSKEFTGKEIQE